MLIKTRTVALAVAGSLVLAAVVPASAQVARPLAAQITAPADVTQVRWRGHGWGWGVGAGIAAGALIGAGIAASRPYYYDPYYYGPAYYGPPPVVYGAPAVGDGVAYCMRRFRSYDPASGTYLGYDGYRHPCP